jgi:hypothetical protein
MAVTFKQMPRSPRAAQALRYAIVLFALASLARPVTAAKPPSNTVRPSSVLRLAALGVDGRPAGRGSALDALAAEVRLRTSVETGRRAVDVGLSDDSLFAYPLLFWSAGNQRLRHNEAQIGRLREHLNNGGILWIDDPSPSGPSAETDAVVRELMRRLFGRPMVRVAANDVIFRSFYRLGAPVGRRADVKALEGIRVGRRWAVLYSRDDLLGAFARASTGGPALPVVPGNEPQREQAIRLGINLVMYAVCLDYKDDHNHVEALLRKRRGRGQSDPSDGR